jgi:hypothetical protein
MVLRQFIQKLDNIYLEWQEKAVAVAVKDGAGGAQAVTDGAGGVPVRHWEWYESGNRGKDLRPWLRNLYVELCRSGPSAREALNRMSYVRFIQIIYELKVRIPQVLIELPQWMYIVPEFHVLVLELERDKRLLEKYNKERERVREESITTDTPEDPKATLHALLVTLQSR